MRLGFDKDKMGTDVSEGALDRASAERIARINAQGRLDVAGMRGAQGSGRDYVIQQGPDGRVWRVNKVTGMADEVHISPDGSVTVGDQSQAGAGPQLIGSGARPGQGELESAAAYNNLQTQFDQYKANLAKVGNQPPSIGTQFLMDGSKSTGLGPISSLTRSLSNTALGSHDPNYQLLQQSLDALGTTVIKMVTGAQMSEPEAQRIMNILRTSAGDTPEKVMQNIETVQNIINSQRVKLNRAGTMLNNPTSGGAQAPAAAPAPAGKKYILPDGTVVE
jgi:hypothetical protein